MCRVYILFINKFEFVYIRVKLVILIKLREYNVYFNYKFLNWFYFFFILKN